MGTPGRDHYKIDMTVNLESESDESQRGFVLGVEWFGFYRLLLESPNGFSVEIHSENIARCRHLCSDQGISFEVLWERDGRAGLCVGDWWRNN